MPPPAHFIAQPVNAAFLILLIVTMLYHAMLGLQVVIEDYVHHPVLEVVFYFHHPGRCLFRHGAWNHPCT